VKGDQGKNGNVGPFGAPGKKGADYKR